MRSCRRTQCQPFYSHLSSEENWKGDKAWQVGVSWADQKFKKIIILKCHFHLFYTTTMNYFLIWLWCVTKSEFYMTTSDDQLSGWTRSSKPLLKAKLAPKKSWSIFDDLPPIWFTAAFWILLKLLHLRIMLSKSMRCTENCNAYSWHWSTEWAQFFSMTTPDCRSYNHCFKNRTNWATKFWVICHYSPEFSPTNYHFFKHLNNFFAGKTLPASGRKCFPRVCWILKHGFLCYRNKLISCWQKCVDYNGSYFD